MAERLSTFLKNAWVFKQANPTYVNKTKGQYGWCPVVSVRILVLIMSSLSPYTKYAPWSTRSHRTTTQHLFRIMGTHLMFPVTLRTLIWMARNSGNTPNWLKRPLPCCPSNKNGKGTNLLNDYWGIFYSVLLKNAILTFKFLRKLIRINHKNYWKKVSFKDFVALILRGYKIKKIKPII